jgi:hypothetical protein
VNQACIDGLVSFGGAVGLDNFFDLYIYLFSVDYRAAVSDSFSADAFGTLSLNSRLGEFLGYFLMVAMVMMMMLWVLLII